MTGPILPIEAVHDFIQWCFPLREASRAVPGAPVLGADAAAGHPVDRDSVAFCKRAVA